MSWADRAIEQLNDGKVVVVHPRGNSMSPYILSGDRVTLEPVDQKGLKKGDIVLARVKGSVYVHFVTAVDGQRVQIGNARGHINGWASAVYGKVTIVEHWTK